MPAIVIKDVPKDLHRLLKEQAERNRRSMSQQLLVILEQALRPVPPLKSIDPIKPRRPFTHEWLMRAMDEGRE